MPHLENGADEGLGLYPRELPGAAYGSPPCWLPRDRVLLSFYLHLIGEQPAEHRPLAVFCKSQTVGVLVEDEKVGQPA